MSAGTERIAAHRDDLSIFHSDSMNAIDDQEHAVFFFAAGVYFSNDIGNAADRKP
jgi:hypothetical protein